MNPGKPEEKTKFGTLAPSLGHALRAILSPAFVEPAMNKVLVALLATACAVNAACLLGHLTSVAG